MTKHPSPFNGEDALKDHLRSTCKLSYHNTQFEDRNLIAEIAGNLESWNQLSRKESSKVIQSNSSALNSQPSATLGCSEPCLTWFWISPGTWPPYNIQDAPYVSPDGVGPFLLVAAFQDSISEVCAEKDIVSQLSSQQACFVASFAHHAACVCPGGVPIPIASI